MDQMRIRNYRDSKWLDPKKLLVRLYEEQPLLQRIATSEKELALENQDQEIYRESREAALFCVGLGTALGREVKFLYDEDQDRDFVVGVISDKGMGLSDLQLKRLPPESLNPHIELEGILVGLNKYVDSKDLVVAIMASRNIELDLNSIKLPDSVKLREAYIFGAIEPNQSKWFIYGDLCSNDRAYYEYDYPTNET